MARLVTARRVRLGLRESLDLPIMGPLAASSTQRRSVHELRARRPCSSPGHRVRSGLSVCVEAGTAPSMGCWIATTTQDRVFSREEVQFVQDVADNCLGAAIERSQMDATRWVHQTELGEGRLSPSA